MPTAITAELLRKRQGEHRGWGGGGGGGREGEEEKGDPIHFMQTPWKFEQLAAAAATGIQSSKQGSLSSLQRRLQQEFSRSKEAVACACAARQDEEGIRGEEPGEIVPGRGHGQAESLLHMGGCPIASWPWKWTWRAAAAHQPCPRRRE